MRAFMVALPVAPSAPQFADLALAVFEILTVKYPDALFWVGSGYEMKLSVRKILNPEEVLPLLLDDAEVAGAMLASALIVTNAEEADGIADWIAPRYRSLSLLFSEPGATLH